MGEVRIVDEIALGARPGAVWAAIEDPAAHAGWHPFVTRISGDHRLGARRACEVDLGKTKGHTRERCIAHEAERRIAWRIEEDSTGLLRLVSDWTAGFELRPDGSGSTLVTAESVFRPKSLLVRPMIPLVRRKFHQTQRTILGALKDTVERPPTSDPTGCWSSGSWTPGCGCWRCIPTRSRRPARASGSRGASPTASTRSCCANWRAPTATAFACWSPTATRPRRCGR
jgi:uncharacterized protein YndB with AHSA1/START domain